MNAIIGFSGFVGSHLIHYVGNNVDYYNTKNIDKISGHKYDIIFCAGVYAEKWRANADPETDIKQIKHLQTLLSTVECKEFILISTIDVLNCSISQYETRSEGDNPPIYAEHAYGRHRRQLEDWVLGKYPTVRILRLPALFGLGMKKNALYDLIHKNNNENLRSHWAFQWYNIEWLVDDIEWARKGSHTVINCVTPTIVLEDIQKQDFPHTILSSKEDVIVNYRLKSDVYPMKYHITILSEISDYVRSIMNPPRILVSELAWKTQYDQVMNSFLNAHGLSIEAVPTKTLWDLSKYTTPVYSAQSLLFGETIQVFEEQERFIQIMERIVNVLSVKQVRVLVFGSPKQRIYSGQHILDMFKRIGDLCAARNMYFCIENNAKSYGCNWLTTVHECIEFVKTVNHPHVRVNLDTGSCFMEGGVINIEREDIQYIQHVQISFPNLEYWDQEWEPQVHRIVKNLQASGYSNYYSLEMREKPDLPFDSILRFLQGMALYQRSL
jgi:hypothetical protein